MRISIPLILLPLKCFWRPRAAALLMFSMVVSQCQSQFRPPHVEITDEDTVGYTLISAEENDIENRAALEPVFRKMRRQRTEGGQKISIVHLGDSHILGNYMTNEVRIRLQRAFGDAGRGLIFPYRLANSNGPRDYLVETDVHWNGSNCQRDPDGETPYGISGFILESFSTSGQLTLRLRDTSTLENHLFTKVTIFHHREEEDVNFRVRDEYTNQEAVLFLQDDYFQSFYFAQPVVQATIEYSCRDSEKNNGIRLDGILLENELSGVVYHSIGVNGGKFSDFVRARYFARELADLNPDLIIMSFGTNEAQGRLNTRYLYDQIDQLVSQIRKYAPKACFLFTTPADSYLRGRGFNPYMGPISAVIRQYARDKHFALWDLFQLSGGEKSAQHWKSAGLMSSDSVHYSKAGYAVQGKSLYQSLIRAYNEFAQER